MGIDNDPWLALQFDNAVALVGNAIENASQEQVKTGSDSKPEWRNKYTMSQLLDPDFRLPTKEPELPIGPEIKYIDGIVYDEVS